MCAGSTIARLVVLCSAVHPIRPRSTQVKSLAPAKAFVCIVHEADHNIDFATGNTPANYRKM